MRSSNGDGRGGKDTTAYFEDSLQIGRYKGKKFSITPDRIILSQC